MEFKGVLCLGVLLVFFSAIASAELNLVVTASLDNSTTDVFLQTNDDATSGFDIYDLEYPPFPMSSPKLFSVIENGGRELIMDSWKGENRNLQLVFSREEADLGVLDLKFNGDISSTFRVVLHDYGDDSGYKNQVGASLITGGAVYTVDSSENERFFSLEVDYLFCGDGVCSDDEGCSVCSVDCSGCEVAGTSDPYHFLTPLEVRDGYTEDFSFGEGYKFNFKDSVHSVRVIAVTFEVVKLLVGSTPMSLDIKWNEEKEVDIDSDSVADFVLKPSLASSGLVTLDFKGLDVDNFGEVSNDDRAVVLEKVSIFDKVYGRNSPAWLRIVVSVGLLVVGFGLLFFAFFLLRAKMKGQEIVSVPVVPVSSSPVQPVVST